MSDTWRPDPRAEVDRELDDLRAAAAATLDFARHRLGADHAGLARHHGEALVPLAHTDELVADLYLSSHQDGPWMPPPTPGRSVRIDDSRTDTRFLSFSTHLVARGIHSFSSVGLAPLRGLPVTLDLYGLAPHAFSESPDGAGPVLELAQALLVLADRVENLLRALRTREVIAQAQGILMQRFGLTAPQAMNYLRRYSQASQVKVRDLAGRVVAGSEMLTAPDPTDGLTTGPQEP
ncbi:hypothetical protein BH11ACT8_BH11ACT8_27760 [soil metagenome]